MSCSLRRGAYAAAALVAVLAAAGVALAAGEPDTTIAVAKRALVASPARSPVDFPGVPRAAAGEPLAPGYVAVARGVRITRGAEAAFAALRLTCPRRKAWRSGASSGEIAMSVLDRRAAGKRSVLVLARIDARTLAAGETARGMVYALCR